MTPPDQSAHHRSVRTQHGPGLSGPRRGQRGRVRVLRAAAAGAARLSAWRPDSRTRSPILRPCASRRREIDWLKSTGRFRDNLLDYLADFRFTGDVHAIPEGTRLLSQRAADPHHRAAAAGAARRDAADQHSAFPDADRLESRAHGAGRARKNSVRLRPAHRAWRRGRHCSRRAPATSPALPAPPMCSPASATAFRSSAPWRTPSCRCTATR